jgi:hypothetical protein
VNTVQNPEEAAQGRRMVAVILERPACLTCLAAKVGATTRDAARALDWIASAIRFNAQVSGHCRLCDGITGPVYSIARPDGRDAVTPS